MATTKTVNTVYKVDTSQFQKGIKEANNALKLAKKQFEANTKGMSSWSKSTEGITAKLKLLQQQEEQHNKIVEENKKYLERLQTANTKYTQDLEKLKNKKKELVESGKEETYEYKQTEKAIKSIQATLETQRKKIETCNNTIQLHETELEGIQNETKRWETSLESLKQEENRVEEQTEDLTDKFEGMDGIGSVVDSITDSFINFVKTGISQAINGVEQFIEYSIEAGKAFEESISNVAALSGASALQTQELTEKALEIAGSTKYTATEMADALGYMAMAGWKTEDMLDGLDGVTQLATASGSDLATTSDIVTDALTAFGKTAKDSSRLADIMAKTSSSANTNVELMGETFKYAAPIAATLGYSMEDVAGATALMANAGIKGESAGTALRSTFTNLSAPTDAIKQQLEELGVSLTDANGEMKPMREVLSDLRSAFSKLSETEQTAAAKTIAGKNAMSGFLAIMNTSQEEADLLQASIDNSAGSAQKMADTMSDNLAGSMNIMQSSAEGAGIALFNNFGGDIRDVVDLLAEKFKELTKQFSYGKMGRQAKKIASEIKKLSEKLIDLGSKAIPKVMDGIEWVIDHKDILINGIKGLATAIVGLKVYKTINPILSTAKSSFSLLTGILTNNVTAVTGVTGALGSGTSTINNFATAAMNAGGGAKGLLGGLSSLINPATLAIGAVAGLSVAIAKYVDSQKEELEVNQELMDSIDETLYGYESLKSGIESSTKTLESNLETTFNNLTSINDLYSKAQELNNTNKNNLSEFEKQSLEDEQKQIVSQLQELLPELEVYYDEKTGLIKLDKEELEKNTKALEDNAKAQEQYTLKQNAFSTWREATEELEDINKQITDLTNEYIDKNLELEDKKAELDNINSKWILSLSDRTRRVNLMDEISELSGYMLDMTDKFEELNTAQQDVEAIRDKAVEEYTNPEKIINQAYANIDEASKEFTSKVNEESKKAEEQNKINAENEASAKATAIKDNTSTVVNEQKSQAEAQVQAASVTRKMAQAGENNVTAYTGSIVVKSGEVKNATAQVKEAAISGMQGNDEFINIGSNIVSGIKSGISGAWEGLTSWFSSLSSGLPETLKKVLNINSPSKVFAGIASSIPEGIQVGIEKNAKLAYGAVEDLGNGLTSHFNIPDLTPAVNAISGGSETIGASTINQTFNQYNTSPKALDIKTQYRQTKNILSFAARKRS